MEAGDRAVKSTLTKNLLRFAKLSIFTLVLWGLYRSCAQARHDLADQQYSLSQLNGGWLFAAAVLYLFGLLPLGWYWHFLLHRMGQTPGRLESLRAYLIGHLGKYVPGKFMVVEPPWTALGKHRTHSQEATYVYRRRQWAREAGSICTQYIHICIYTVHIYIVGPTVCSGPI